jgi:hypothetical protein
LRERKQQTNTGGDKRSLFEAGSVTKDVTKIPGNPVTPSIFAVLTKLEAITNNKILSKINKTELCDD